MGERSEPARAMLCHPPSSGSLPHSQRMRVLHRRKSATHHAGPAGRRLQSGLGSERFSFLLLLYDFFFSPLWLSGSLDLPGF